MHLLKDPESKLRLVFWKNLTDHNLDINNTNTLEDNYKEFGYISQLFTIK